MTDEEKRAADAYFAEGARRLARIAALERVAQAARDVVDGLPCDYDTAGEHEDDCDACALEAALDALPGTDGDGKLLLTECAS